MVREQTDLKVTFEPKFIRGNLEERHYKHREQQQVIECSKNMKFFESEAE